MYLSWMMADVDEISGCQTEFPEVEIPKNWAYMYSGVLLYCVPTALKGVELPVGTQDDTAVEEDAALVLEIAAVLVDNDE